MNNAMGAARDAIPADLLIKDARVVNVLSGEIHTAGVGLYGDLFLGFGSYQALEKLMAAGSKVIDGHCPGLSGKDFKASILAGPSSDHESVGLEEAREKLRREPESRHGVSGQGGTG